MTTPAAMIPLQMTPGSSTGASSLAKTILTSSPLSFTTLLKKHSKPKPRSHETHHTTHLPLLTNLPPNSLTTVLIGDSRLERFSWYSPSSVMNHLPHSFNAGCGGDKIENVLYRISEGLLEVMKEKKVLPKLWVVSVGTNNLRPKGRSGLRDGEVEAFLVLLSALLRAAPGSKVLMTELSYRTDIGDEIVDVVNEQMKGAVGDINAALERERVVWHSLPEIRKQEHLLDHVHFNEEGYMAWDEKLAGDVEVLVGEGTC